MHYDGGIPMEHLNNTEIIDFIKISEFDEKSRQLLKRVNSHIFECPECAKKIEMKIRAKELLEAMSCDSFSVRDLYASGYDVPAEAAAYEGGFLSDEEEGHTGLDLD